MIDSTSYLELGELRAANIKRNREWSVDLRDVPKMTLSFRAIELAGEVGEACNEVKKLERTRLGLVGGKTDLEGLASELADVLISVDLLAMDCSINLAEAVRRKFNATSKKYGMTTHL